MMFRLKIILLFYFLSICTAYAQDSTSFSFQVVDMMPRGLSDEEWFDAETNIAVNPSNPDEIAGSAFTYNPTGDPSLAPIYITSDGGATWALSNIVPSKDGKTNDISLEFGTTSGMLYAGILMGGEYLHSLILRTSNPLTDVMTPILDRKNESTDQPYLCALSANDGGQRDKIFSGINDKDAPDGKTAEVMACNDATALKAVFNVILNERRMTGGTDYPAIRTAIHPSGVVYSVFYRWVNGDDICDIVIVRDDNFAKGEKSFEALIDPIDSVAGVRIARDRCVPAFGDVKLGFNPLRGSNLSVAVDPENSGIVYVAWCDRVDSNDYTLHLKRSTNVSIR